MANQSKYLVDSATAALASQAQNPEAHNPAAQDIESMTLPLSPSKRVEFWSGRLAMMGFAVTVAAIALKTKV